MGLTNMQKILRNPAFGLLPVLVFSFLIVSTNQYIAMAIGLSLSILGALVVKKYSRLIYELSVIAFLASLVLCFFMAPQLDSLRVFIVVEVTFVLSLIISRLVRTRIVLRLARKNNPLVKNYLTESFRIAFQAQYGLSIHLLIILGFFVFSTITHPLFNRLLVLLIPQIILILLIFMEGIRLRILDKKLYREEWLPVVTETGDVTGRVAKSVTKDMKNKFMHPVVRVALIFKGRIYLKERDQSRLLDPGMLDYPFEKYMQYNHDIEEAVRNSIGSESKNSDIPVRFLLKYIFENENTKRLVFLYVSEIVDEITFNSLNLTGGKLWTETQIEDNIGNNIFSECFELEFEYLKNTVLLSYHLKNTDS